jgi:hypothetical protein
MGKKISYEYVYNFFKKEGCELLDDVYVNCRSKVNYICGCGEKRTVRVSAFMRGDRCIVCRQRIKDDAEEICNMTEQQMSIFDGLMISDAYLKKTNSEWQNSSFKMMVKSREFAETVYNIFPSFPWSNSPIKTFDVYDKRTNNYHSSTVLSSKANLFFTKQRRRWYPNGKKIVPSDIKIDKDMLLWWYIGDGYLCRKKARPNYRRIELATDSFSQNEIFNLIGLLKSFLNEDDNIYEERNEIMIGKKALCRFASLFENSCPVNYYKYKFEFGQYLNKNYLKDLKEELRNRPFRHTEAFLNKKKFKELNLIAKMNTRKVGE